ncbi:MAG: sodium:solute symporter family protein [Bacteroidota bacterium]
MEANQIIILLFMLCYFGFILYTRRKGDFEEYSVAGRSLGIGLIFASFCATSIGPASTLGFSRAGYNLGGFYLYFVAFAALTTSFTAFYIAPKVRAKFPTSKSMGDIVGGRNSHNHQAIQCLVGLVGLGMMSAVTIAMAYAGGELVNNVFGFSKTLSIIVLTIIVIIYASFGGIRATIQTDAFQFVIFIILIPALALLIINNPTFSWSSYIEHTAQLTDTTISKQSISDLSGTLFFFIFGYLYLSPDYLGRFMSARTPTVARTAGMLAAIFLSSWVILMVFIGSAGAFLSPNLTDSDQLLLNIAEHHFPSILYSLFIVAMLGVVMSTMDSTINSASILFSEDIIGRLNKRVNDKDKLKYAKLFTATLGMAAIIIASFLSSILEVIMYLFSFYTPIMVPTALFAILKSKHYWQAGLASMIGGFVYFLGCQMIGASFFPPEIAATFLSFLT